MMRKDNGEEEEDLEKRFLQMKIPLKAQNPKSKSG